MTAADKKIHSDLISSHRWSVANKLKGRKACNQNKKVRRMLGASWSRNSSVKKLRIKTNAKLCDFAIYTKHKASVWLG